jgi:hypothetical protein
MEAMVSEPPISDRKPNTRPAVPIAIPSGRSLSGVRKTTARVMTIAARAAARRTKIWVESSSASPSNTTGTPLTT